VPEDVERIHSEVEEEGRESSLKRRRRGGGGGGGGNVELDKMKSGVCLISELRLPQAAASSYVGGGKVCGSQRCNLCLL